MEEIKQKINFDLANLNKIKPVTYTARDLHGQKNHLLKRVQRKEDKRYFKEVEAKKKRLNFELEKISMYNQRLQFEINRRNQLMNQWALTRVKINPDGSKALVPPPVFQALSRVVPKPVISLGTNPNIIKTRTERIRRYRRRR